jgi:endoglycosylceramidase
MVAAVTNWALAGSNQGIASGSSIVQVDPHSQHFVVPDGRVLIMHGVNAVFKVPPFVPPTSFCDATTSMCSKDIAWLKSNGFNGIRFGVMWRAVMPSPGIVNTTYLAEVVALVKALEDAGIYTIIDAHQDVLNPQFCGEGFPDYAVRTNASASEAFPFPLPANISVDPSTGLPSRESCLRYNFAQWMFTLELNQAWGALFNRSTGLQARFEEHWSVVAAAFANASEHVLAYELVNEPYAGDAFANPLLLLDPPLSESVNLMPMYENLNTAIRAKDANRIVMYDRMVLAPYFGQAPGFKSGPGGPAADNKQALSAHLYCIGLDAGGNIENVTICEDVYDLTWTRILDDVQILGGGRALTEFGAIGDDEQSSTTLSNVMDRADAATMSAFYWQFKPFHDYTTNNASVEGLFFPNGTLQQDKYDAIVRPYPQKTPAVPSTLKYRLDKASGDFSLNYTLSDTATNRTTVLFAPDVVYPNGGPRISLVPESSGTVRQLGQFVMVDHAATAQGAVTVRLSRQP